MRRKDFSPAPAGDSVRHGKISQVELRRTLEVVAAAEVTMELLTEVMIEQM